MSEAAAAPPAPAAEGGKAPRPRRPRNKKSAEGADGDAPAAEAPAPVEGEAAADDGANAGGGRRRRARRQGGRGRRQGGEAPAAGGADAPASEEGGAAGGRGRRKRRGGGRRNSATNSAANEARYASIINPHEMFAGEKDQADPKAQLKEWISLWLKSDRRQRRSEHHASLCSQEADGMPNVRLVEVKDVDDDGNVILVTTVDSARSQLSANSRAALLINWQASRRWINLKGAAEALPSAEADAQWALLRKPRQVAVWTSLQGGAANTPDEMTTAAKEAEGRFVDGTDVPRPDSFVLYKFTPTVIEFNSHRKPPQSIRYERRGTGEWGRRLQYI